MAKKTAKPKRAKRSRRIRPAAEVAAEAVEQSQTETEPDKPTRGRPPGSKTEKQVAEQPKSRCKKCGSTERNGYSNTRVIRAPGNDPKFGHYTHVVFRTTRCLNCNQARSDRSLENRK